MSRNLREPVLSRKQEKLDAQSVPAGPVPSLLEFVRKHLKLDPDPEQTRLLKLDPRRCLLNCTRQWGKSTITAAKAVHKALAEPKSLTVVLSPSARQSAEFVLKARNFFQSIGISTKTDGHNEISILLPNRSRIIGLPSSEDKIRGFSAVSLLLIDEAARVEDSLYGTVRPMLAASDGQFWLLSTPNGRAGFFYHEWTSNPDQWTRFEIPASKCPRINPQFLDEERVSQSETYFRREYCCEFLDRDGAVFPYSLLENALSDIDPLPIDPGNLRIPIVLPSANAHLSNQFLALAMAKGIPAAPDPQYFIGVDIGQIQDYTAIAIVERVDLITGPQDRITYDWERKTLRTVRYLQRVPLNTPYRDVARLVASLTRHPAIARRGNKLIVDGTGVGEAVIELIRDQHPDPIIHTVKITGGASENRRGDTHWMPRNALLGRLELGLQDHALTISRKLPLAKDLLEELQNLHRDPNDPKQETIRAERQSIHDDLVFATALAYWRAACRF